MRSRSAAIAIGFSLLSGGVAVGCYLRASRLQGEAEWYLARANAAADEYAATFDNAAAETQLATFEQRRDLLERAHGWQRLQLIAILIAVVAAFASYLLHLFSRLREEVSDATSDEARAL